MYFVTVVSYFSGTSLHQEVNSLVRQLENLLIDEESYKQLLVLLGEELKILGIKHRHRKPLTIQITEKSNLIHIYLEGNVSIYLHHVQNTITCNELHPVIPTNFFHQIV